MESGRVAGMWVRGRGKRGWVTAGRGSAWTLWMRDRSRSLMQTIWPRTSRISWDQTRPGGTGMVMNAGEAESSSVAWGEEALIGALVVLGFGMMLAEPDCVPDL